MSTHTIRLFVLAHILIICVSNMLVQQPITLFGQTTTWGAFSYPLIFILTDLCTRLTNAKQARNIVYLAMLPGLTSSFLISNWYSHGQFWVWDSVALRIALASFSAYLLGQLSDIIFFQKLKHYQQWWLAPMVANIIGNIFDTYCFFFIAFYHSSHVFLSLHWPEIASVDLGFKLVISLVSVVPIYGLILNWFLSHQRLLAKST